MMSAAARSVVLVEQLLLAQVLRDAPEVDALYGQGEDQRNRNDVNESYSDRE
jgi:hypothetical protein